MAKKAKSKGFFALDVHQFERIRQNNLGVEEAATYLSLLKSTDQSNVVSSGGVRSVMDYSGLSRAEVKRAIRHLESRGLVDCLEVERKRARKAERYNLPIHDSRRSLSPKERGIVDAIEAGQQPTGNSDIQAAHRAATKGWIEKRSDDWQIIEYSNTVAFIPNSFVQVSEGHSPLYRLVNGGELGPIMLANGKTPEHDEYAYNRPQRPLGVLRNGRQVLNTPESRPAFMAFLVYKLKQADGQLTESLPQLIQEWQSSGWVFAFENASVSHVEGVSVLRLTHRAATDNTKVWWRDLCEECDKAFFFVEMAARSYFPQISGIVQEIQNTPDFKEAISMKINDRSIQVQ